MPHAKSTHVVALRGERVRCKQDGMIGTVLRYAAEQKEFPYIIEWDWPNGKVTEACSRDEFELLTDDAV